jgi:hypothetical protein
MKKTFLLILSIVFVVIGFLAIMSWQPGWLSWVEIILGLIGIIIAFGKD